MAFIAGWETYARRPYICAGGAFTWGFGHAMKKGEIPPESIELDAAHELLLRDVQDCADDVSYAVHVPLEQHHFDALVSFVYNIGYPRFRTSTLLRLLNASDYPGAAMQFSRWVWADGKVLRGLVKRRAAEQRIFELGVGYDARP